MATAEMETQILLRLLGASIFVVNKMNENRVFGVKKNKFH